MGRSLRPEFAMSPKRTLNFTMRAFCVLVGLLLASESFAAEKRPRIVTSFFPIYCWTVNVAGEFAEVENLLPARAEPHDYAFKADDARKLAKADLVIINGLGLESWLPAFKRSGAIATNKIVAVTTGLGPQLLFGEHHHHHGAHDDHDHGHEQPNEHTWLDPQLAAHGVSNILHALQRLDPAHAANYASNAQAYIARLHRLDADIRAKLGGITNRAIITYHDAFPYFAKRYGLEVAAVVEKVPTVNPSPKHLTELGKTIRARKIPVIFVPPGGRTTLARRLAEDLKVKLADLATLESGPLSPSAYEQHMLGNAIVLETYLK
jgi:zinc transport system substrate-binding protein